ncbi:dihydrofolate reductase family protein [Actinoplanes regularis]|uniref:Dihydrofolate reductase n=1 Tax=Actinoplanes regularis TaxID=52697 RepID=A0A238WAA5_9ACTN|nr:dihydrofolate reductase family protein [Actinoplanes regularis]GIE85095.1 DNA-binding protein [Actinoplanes regularis]GLW27283.1 DNA-binding protein [Actinoplanes regularis]SNR43516.1 Dihydrofolate reductase [Actinoplanes regularis]
MARVIADISISLDGFVTGPNPGLENGLGDGGEALHTWALHPDPVDHDVLDSTVAATGAVIMGRRLFDIVDGPHGWTDEMGYGADRAAEPPVLVVTRQPPARVRLADRMTFVVDGVAGAVSKGLAIAGDRDVVIMGGAAVIRGALDAGLVDELRLHLAPVLLGAGTPLFGDGRLRRLRQVHVRPSGNATHLTYLVH